MQGGVCPRLPQADINQDGPPGEVIWDYWEHSSWKPDMRSSIGCQAGQVRQFVNMMHYVEYRLKLFHSEFGTFFNPCFPVIATIMGGSPMATIVDPVVGRANSHKPNPKVEPVLTTPPAMCTVSVARPNATAG
jgi:hypothetical protein